MKKILLSFFAILLLGVVGSCSSVPEKNPSLQRQWMLVSFDKFSKEELIKNRAEINLTGALEKGKIKGSANMGCNGMFFTSEFKANGKVKISGVGSTLKACQNMELENAFIQKFDKMTDYSIEGHFLTLSDDNGNSMKFVAADWD
ncbi:META domain-containing protein [Chryseobacterium lathyri]|uniref:Heat shock protein HslJ n=1 Tax=Chryseobacterium lathyri TaxID=395933 RepID=A0ABT9SGT2_9FLAO|nr:META domain-containing protein [Chryseobacterium lathyri]MDP9958641.1 heat shock protein HslJ [Chryseobacterium lathyri]MDQ0066674.1 heat shock protein HslJ [Chryseobacterium lathyri]